jgi:hypothetical protein
MVIALLTGTIAAVIVLLLGMRIGWPPKLVIAAVAFSITGGIAYGLLSETAE